MKAIFMLTTVVAVFCFSGVAWAHDHFSIMVTYTDNSSISRKGDQVILTNLVETSYMELNISQVMLVRTYKDKYVVIRYPHLEYVMIKASKDKIFEILEVLNNEMYLYDRCVYDYGGLSRNGANAIPRCSR